MNTQIVLEGDGQTAHFSQKAREVGHPEPAPIHRECELYLNDLTAAASSSFTSKTV
jgi:hypothetical protein